MFFVSCKLDHYKPSSDKVKWLDQLEINSNTWNCTNISYITLLKLQHILLENMHNEALCKCILAYAHDDHCILMAVYFFKAFLILDTIKILNLAV